MSRRLICLSVSGFYAYSDYIATTAFISIVLLRFGHGLVNHIHQFCGMQLLFDALTSTAIMALGNGCVIMSHSSCGCDYSIQLQLPSVNKRGPWEKKQ